MNPTTRFRLGAAILVTGAFVACSIGELNPQPLPPGGSSSGGSTSGDYANNGAEDAGTMVVSAPYADAATEGNADGAITPPKTEDAGPDDASTDASPDADAGDAAIN